MNIICCRCACALIKRGYRCWIMCCCILAQCWHSAFDCVRVPRCFSCRVLPTTFATSPERRRWSKWIRRAEWGKWWGTSSIGPMCNSNLRDTYICESAIELRSQLKVQSFCKFTELGEYVRRYPNPNVGQWVFVVQRIVNAWQFLLLFASVSDSHNCEDDWKHYCISIDQ